MARRRDRGLGLYYSDILGGVLITFLKQIIATTLLLSFMGGPSMSLASDKEVLYNPLGQSRLLVMCLPNDRELSLDEKSFIYKTDWAGFAERDLLLIGLNEQVAFNFLAQDSESDTGANGLRSQYIFRKNISGEGIRKRVNCAHDFGLILVGKDTGIKAHWASGFTQQELFSLIDAMPMRRYEMREKAKEK